MGKPQAVPSSCGRGKRGVRSGEVFAESSALISAAEFQLEGAPPGFVLWRSLMKKFLSLLLAVSFSLGLFTAVHAADDTADYGALWGSVIIPDGLSGKDVKQGTLMAAAGRGWIIKDKSPNEKIVLFREEGSWVSSVVLTYDKTEMKIDHKSAKGGKSKEPSWLRYLKQDIQKNLTVASISK